MAPVLNSMMALIALYNCEIMLTQITRLVSNSTILRMHMKFYVIFLVS